MARQAHRIWSQHAWHYGVEKVSPLHREPHEKWSAARDRSWRRLDEPERIAWRMFPSVEGQVSVRETWRKSSEDKSRQFAVLDGVFADGVMREWHGLDLDLVPRVWEGLRLLHDLSWQDGAESSRLCWHEDAPLALAHGLGSEHRGRSCPRCAERFRCERCWTRNEWHSGCEG